MSAFAAAAARAQEVVFGVFGESLRIVSGAQDIEVIGTFRVHRDVAPVAGEPLLRPLVEARIPRAPVSAIVLHGGHVVARGKDWPIVRVWDDGSTVLRLELGYAR